MKRVFAMLAVLALVAPGPASAARADRRGPRVTYTTTEGAILVGGPAGDPTGQLPVAVVGRIADNRSGVHSVEATWVWCTTGSATSCSVIAAEPPLADGGAVELDCNRTRRSCRWTAPAPTAPGAYWFSVEAMDHAGNESKPAGILHLTVV